MCPDPIKVNIWEQLRQRDAKVVDRFLTPAVVAQAAEQSACAYGRGPLNLAALAWLAVVAAIHTAKNFADVLLLVLKLTQDDAGWAASPLAALQRRGQQQRGRSPAKPHDPRGSDPCQLSEEAFSQARGKVPPAFWVNLLLLLSDRCQQEHPQQMRWRNFRLLALDGTTINLPAWRPLRDHFGTAGKGKGRRRTQARLVLLELPLARLPWRYELTPLADSERTVAARLLHGLQPADLVLMDRGFWSYALFQQIAQQQAAFAIRRIAQAHLPRVKKLGRNDELVRYRPSHWRKAWTAAGWPREQTLRVISYQLQGFRPSAVVTNLLDPQQVSRDDWVRLAAVDDGGRVVEPGLYHRRWEIETTFRELKVTQGLEGSLRSRTPAGIGYEVAGHLLLYLVVRWLLLEAAAAAGEVDPLRLSFKAALQEFLDMRQTLLHADAGHVRRVLWPRLLARLASHVVPLRPGRHYARPGDTQAKDKGHGQMRPAHKLKAS
jgi:Transposase DDE domain